MGRVLALLLLTAVSWFLPGEARAANCEDVGDQCTYVQAWTACEAWKGGQPISGGTGLNYEYRCLQSEFVGYINGQRRATYTNGNPPSGWGNLKVYRYVGNPTCPPGQTLQPGGGCKDTRCESAPPVVTHPGKEGWAACQSYTDSTGTYSCVVSGVRPPPNAPFGGYVVWQSSGSKCEPPTFECPAEYIKAADGTCEPVPECPPGVPREADGECVQPAECPLGMAKDATGTCVPEENICPAGQIKGPDGSCIEDSGQCGAGKVKGGDGTCKPDADGDGNPDDPEEGEEGKHKAEDSVRCDQPPVCSGDEIMCLHAKQLWRIDCNTRKARQVQMDKYCERPPVCNAVALGDDARNTGCDAVEESALYLQWKNACATEAVRDLIAKGGSGGTDNADAGTHQRLDKMQAWLDGTGKPALEAPEMPIGEMPMQSQEWSSGLAGGGSCPAPETVNVSLGSYSASVSFGFEVICQFATYLYAVWVSMGGLLAAFIIAGVRK